VPPATGETPLQRAERISEERFALISSMYQQSEVWKKAYQDQGAAHAEGQFLLESRLEQLHVAFRRAIQQINEMRQNAGLEPVEVANELLRDPAGVAKSYRDRLVAIGLAAQASDDAIECPGTGGAYVKATLGMKLHPLAVLCPVCRAQVGLRPGDVVASHPPARPPAAP